MSSTLKINTIENLAGDAVIQTSDIMKKSGDSMTGLLNANGGISINNAPLSAGQRKNYLINGNFDMWQRGVGPTIVNGVYVADRWYGAGQGGVGTHEKALLGSGDGKRACLVAYKYSDAMIDIRQGIELPTIGANFPFAVGKTFTISFYAYSLVGGENITVDSYFRAGIISGTYTTDMPQTSVGTLQAGVAQKFTKTFTISATAGASDATYVVAIKTLATKLTIYGIKLEDGSVATEGWHPYDGEFGGEVQACQRYYEKNSTGRFLTYCTAANGVSTPVFFKSMKRVVPSITFLNTVYTNASSIASYNVNQSTFDLFAISTAGNMSAVISDFTASAEL